MCDCGAIGQYQRDGCDEFICAVCLLAFLDVVFGLWDEELQQVRWFRQR